jgi:hypothetical protein
MSVQYLFLNFIENIFLGVGTVLESTNAQVVDIQRLTAPGRARPRNPMITRALRLLEELGDLSLVRFFQEIGSSNKRATLTTRQESNNANLFTETNSFSFVVIDSTFD